MSNVIETSRLRALVVDDDPVLRRLLAKQLSRFGCDARWCSSGEMCLRVAEWVRPHLIVLDLAMPGMDGFRVAESLQARSLMPPLLVALTGYDNEEMRERSKQAGFHQHLIKPIHFASLNLLVMEAKSRTKLVAC